MSVKVNGRRVNTGFESVVRKSLKSNITETEKWIKENYDSAIWRVLTMNKGRYTTKLRRIIKSEYYDTFAESEYYDRTYQFMKVAKCVPEREGKKCRLNIFYDTQKVAVFSPSKKGNFWSYAYSWNTGSESVGEVHERGEPVSSEFITFLYKEMDDRAEITAKFFEWFQDDFNDSLYKVLRNRKNI